MITITTLRGRKLVLNAELIESIEAIPDTLITLTTGKRLRVQEPPEVIAARVEAYMRRAHPWRTARLHGPESPGPRSEETRAAMEDAAPAS